LLEPDAWKRARYGLAVDDQDGYFGERVAAQ